MPVHRTRADATRYFPTLPAWKTRGNALSILIFLSRYRSFAPVGLTRAVAKGIENAREFKLAESLTRFTVPLLLATQSQHKLLTQNLIDQSH